MITIKSIDQKNRRGFGPLMLKIAGLFAVALIAGFIGLFAIRSMLSIAERGAVERPLQNQAEQIVIDPKMESDLSNALTFQAVNEPGQVLDPFSDRAGLTETAASRATPAATCLNRSIPSSTSLVSRWVGRRWRWRPLTSTNCCTRFVSCCTFRRRARA
mgnify:CR=1 FL=1